jgi:UDPglucose 6-dehydrogenase
MVPIDPRGERGARQRQATGLSSPPLRNRDIAVIGSGYVGLTLSACLASAGHRVICTDRSIDRVLELSEGLVPIVETDLPDLVREGLESGRLRFRTDNIDAVGQSGFVFLCLPTPEGADGTADLSFVERVATEIGPHLLPGAKVITKSTVPVGTHLVVEEALGRSDVHVVSNPEFLAEGSAVEGCLKPDRIVVGARSVLVAEEVASLYGPELTDRWIITDLASSELIKYASNAYLATRLTFVNSMAEMCEAAGADIRAVVAGMGSDHRIGPAFLHPGPGWGGSCFPKDTQALVHSAHALGCDLELVSTAITLNARHTSRIVEKIERAVPGELATSRIGIWGLSFKAGTDDLRQSPALAIARALVTAGASVHAYDPTLAPGTLHGLEAHSSALAACRHADVLVIATEWPEFSEVNLSSVFALMANPAIVDARNLLDPVEAVRHGFSYEAVGIGLGIPAQKIRTAV